VNVKPYKKGPICIKCGARTETKYCAIERKPDGQSTFVQPLCINCFRAASKVMFTARQLGESEVIKSDEGSEGVEKK